MNDGRKPVPEAAKQSYYKVKEDMARNNGRRSGSITDRYGDSLARAGFVHVTGLQPINKQGKPVGGPIGSKLKPTDFGKWSCQNGMFCIVTEEGLVWVADATLELSRVKEHGITIDKAADALMNFLLKDLGSKGMTTRFRDKGIGKDMRLNQLLTRLRNPKWVPA